MGGSLNVTSKENVGSTFSFKLPLQVPKDMISNDVYYMMFDKQDVKKYMVEETLTSAKKIGYVQFSSSSLTPQSERMCMCAHVCAYVCVCVCVFHSYNK
jgi:hypothetical protein